MSDATRTPNNAEVICPNCTHQFRAIPVDVQADIHAAQAALAEARSVMADTVESLQALRAANVFIWPNHSMNPEQRMRTLIAAIDAAMPKPT